LDAMKSSSHNGGVTFFNKIPGLPPLTFIGDYYSYYIVPKLKTKKRIKKL
jgi:hypothetical protein